jgi:hypothetical protein
VTIADGLFDFAFDHGLFLKITEEMLKNRKVTPRISGPDQAFVFYVDFSLELPEQGLKAPLLKLPDHGKLGERALHRNLLHGFKGGPVDLDRGWVHAVFTSAGK